MSEQEKETVKKPVEDPAFWHDRVLGAWSKSGALHEIIWDIRYEAWAHAQDATAALLKQHVRPGQSVIDAGCGYGALIDCLGIAGLIGSVDYLGLDVSPDLIEIGRKRYADKEKFPKTELRVGNLRHLPVHIWGIELPLPNAGSVWYPRNWALCRSVENMIIGQRGQQAWEEMLHQMRGVTERVLIMEYPEDVGKPVEHRIVEGL